MDVAGEQQFDLDHHITKQHLDKDGNAVGDHIRHGAEHAPVGACALGRTTAAVRRDQGARGGQQDEREAQVRQVRCRGAPAPPRPARARFRILAFSIAARP